VADGFARLSGAVRDRYHGEVEEGEGAEPSGGADHREQAEHRPPPEPAAAVDALRDALDGLISAGRDVGQRALDVWRDPDVNAEARHAASSLNEALGATVDMIGREVANLFTPRREREGERRREQVTAERADDEIEAAAGGDPVDDAEPPDEGPNSD
jgi:hypothetical protein